MRKTLIVFTVTMWFLILVEIVFGPRICEILGPHFESATGWAFTPRATDYGAQGNFAVWALALQIIGAFGASMALSMGFGKKK